jgi:hypothetical protein
MTPDLLPANANMGELAYVENYDGDNNSALFFYNGYQWITAGSLQLKGNDLSLTGLLFLK